MPTISIFYGIHIMMCLKDKEHNPPHIHAYYGNKSASFLILTGEILNGDFPNRAAKLVKEFIKIHQDELLDMWETGVYKAIEGLN